MASQLVWTSNTGDAPSGDGHPWYSVEYYTLDQLIELHAELRTKPATERCDNRAPGTCCDDCNIHLIADEIAYRLRLPV